MSMLQRRASSLAAMMAVIVGLPVLLLTGSGCGSDEGRDPVVGPPTATAGVSQGASEARAKLPSAAAADEQPTAAPVREESKTIESIASGGVGQVVRSSGTDGEPAVVVFEETHISPNGQIEIALMMYRLYRDHGLRHIALEGYVEGAKWDVAWFHGRAFDPESKQQVATRLLSQGEVSAAEYLALLLPDLAVHPIENQAEYDVELDKGGAAPTIYLFRIASRTLDRTHLAKIQELQRQNKIKEMIDYVIGTNPWTAEKSKQTDPKAQIIPVERWLSLLAEIEQKSTEVGYQPSAEERESMEEASHFFKTAAKRSETMVRKVVQLVQQHPGAPVAMLIGAAHTDGVCRLLDEQKMSYRVIKPSSLEASHDEANSLSIEAFVRKSKRQSVDARGLGALLDGRKKPQPILSEPWFQAKADLYVVTDIIAAAARRAVGEGPPFGLDTEKDLNLGMIRVEPSTLERIGEDIVFKVYVIGVDPGKPKELWVRARSFGATLPANSRGKADEHDIEKLLLSAWGGGNGQEPPGGRELARFDNNSEKPGRTPKPAEPPLVQVSADTIAEISSDRAVIARAEI